jgi:hypothetical protein
MPDLQTAAVVLFTLAFTYAGLGRALPLNITDPVPFAADLLLFLAYVYLMRTLTRLPIALVITVRRARYAQAQYGLSRGDSWRDGLARGLLDTRRWTVGPLAQLDRLAVVGWTLLATTPYLGVFLVKVGGLIGVAALLLIYLLRGSFTWLVEGYPARGLVDERGLPPFIDRR